MGAGGGGGVVLDSAEEGEGVREVGEEVGGKGKEGIGVVVGLWEGVGG